MGPEVRPGQQREARPRFYRRPGRDRGSPRFPATRTAGEEVMADFCLSCRTFGHCTNDCHLTCELDVPTAREADAPSEELLRIGGLMANTMFNLAQRESLPIRERASFKDMQIAWDAARRAAPRIASMEAQAVAWQCRRPGGSWGPPFTKQAHVEIFL